MKLIDAGLADPGIRNGYIGTISGIEFYTSPHLVKHVERQTFVPKSKKKRIVKKCRKLYTVFETLPDDKVYIIAGNYYCHPSVEHRIRREVALGL